jgi:hypothetical protein
MTGSFCGAWLTDIDDTLIESGVNPDDRWMVWLSKKIQTLNNHGIVWVPMSGVALVKLGPRILYRLPEKLKSGVLYYGGDGSELNYYDEREKRWVSDKDFKRIFTDAQALAVIGRKSFAHAIAESENSPIDSGYVRQRIKAAESELMRNDKDADFCILDLLKDRLAGHGFNPEDSETYFRGGSVSWMMLGDISAEPYKSTKAIQVRKELFALAEEVLAENNFLLSLGVTGITIPFHGARGIKFVLMGNDKERGTRDLIERKKISADSIVFSGNELFDGGNDNMIRNIEGVTLLSVGEKTDPGENVVFGGHGIDANRKWMEFVSIRLEQGVSWRSVIDEMKTREVSHGGSV